MKTKMIHDRYEIIRQIDEGGISKVYLGFDHVSRKEVVVRTLKKEILSNHIEDIIRFRNEAAILSRLDHPHIVKIYEAFEHEGQHYIVMEYILGESLYKILKSGKRVAEDDIIGILIQACAALDYIHRQHIVHRDLKPGNIMVCKDKKDGYSIKVIDFGLASFKEFAAIKDEQEIAGTFCYMSPEHFRVINRNVDERSDLYSLGIILYQLLTGVLPFEGKSTGSIIHQQIAMSPQPPSQHNETVCGTLEKIVLKLLEKEPDRRYQSARGLRRDLEKYQKGEREFPLAMNDKQVRLLFTTGLISRQEELKDLTALYDNALKDRGSVCFIAGEAGKGKTRLAEELRSYVYREGGVFIDGKCFSGKNKTPYGPFKDALNIYVKKYGDYPEDKKQEIKNKLQQSIGGLCGIMVQLNPALAVIFDKSPELVKLEAEREKKRFLMVAAQFFLALSRIEKGLVLFIDDLQWVDEGSMDLLFEISHELSRYPLFVIGTYRNDEIESGHRVNVFKQEAENKQYPYSEMYLDAFDRDMVDTFVGLLLNTKNENIENITEVIYQKSKGNPFFALEILKQFVDDKVVYLKEDVWEIDKEKLAHIEIASTIVDIVMKRISWLSEEEVKVLSYAAVIGRKFDIAILFRLLEYEAAKIISIVDRAIQLQFLEEDPQEKGKVLFVHDRIKEAFYKKCGDKERILLHRKIGEALEQMNQGTTDNVIFDLAYHYIEGNDDEKILEYGYPAGMQAKKNHASEEALSYLLEAIKIWEKRGDKYKEKWQECIEAIGEIYMVMGRNEDAISTFNILLQLKKKRLERASVYKKISQTYFNISDYKNCEKYGAIGLKELKERLPVEKKSIFLGIIKELCIHLVLSILPVIFFKVKKTSYENKYKLIIWFYYSLGWTYILNDITKFIRTILRMFNISRMKLYASKELGLSMAAYASLLMAIPLFKLSVKWHQKALQLRKQIHDVWGTGESLQFMGVCYLWKGDYKKSITCFNESIMTLKKTGDIKEIELALTNLALDYNYLSDYKGQVKIENSVKEYSNKLNDIYGLTESFQRQGILHLEQGSYNEAEKLLIKTAKLNKAKNFMMPLCEVNIYLGVLAYENNDFKKAYTYLEEAKLLYEKNNFMKQYVVLLFSHLTELYIRDFLQKSGNITTEERKKYMRKIGTSVKEALKMIKPWPTHYGGALRAAAKYYMLAGKNKASKKLFLKSIEHCRKIERKYELGKSHYEYGKFLKQTGREEQAKESLESAYIIFKEIGSQVYKKRIVALLGIEEEGEKEGIASIQRLKSQERLDSIIQVSRTISSILNLELLLENIISLAMEITGAQRGYLFIKEKDKDELVLKIKKCIADEKEGFIQVEKQEQYSKNIVDTVFHSGEVVLSRNAEKDRDYAKYESVVHYGLKSVLCVPIKHKNVTIGVCYVDNPLSAAVFSSDDIEILEAMMAQAAISIENARLYEKMKMMKDKAESEVEKFTIHILKKQEKLLDGKSSLIYQSREMQEIVEKVNQAVTVGKPVLITGETGTGKELIAKLIHYSGKHKQEPFIAINCAAVPHTLWETELFGHIKGSFTDAKTNREGSIAAAGKGTLFFDEIGEMPLEIQSKLLRLLQEHQYRPLGSNKTHNAECRFVFSTNRNVEEIIQQGRFREDLYYRINVFRIDIAPLRKRKDDIPILMEYFVKKYAQEFDLPSDIEVEKQAMQRIMAYNWPGNIREMENSVIRALAVLSVAEGDKNMLRFSHFPVHIGSSENIEKEIKKGAVVENQETILVDGNYDAIINEHSRKLIRWALQKAGGNKTVAAEILGIKRTTLNYKIKELSL
jgi:transcriptional regulator with GAF, ATPase, and Fis domain/tRNA A-37 threonylcarbamoyl transferase component Bud32